MKEVERNMYYKYFDSEGLIIEDLGLLPRKNSPFPMGKRERFFEILKLDGDREIRFAIQRPGDCTCRNFIVDSQILIHIRDWLDGKCGCMPDLFDDFKFNMMEEYRLKKLLWDVYPVEKYP